MRTGLFPEGPYVLEIEKVVAHVSQSGKDMWKIVLKLPGTDARFYMWAVDQPNARFRWGDICDRWDDLPDAVGRRFIFPIKVRHSVQVQQDQIVREYNHVDPPIAEVIR
jgi:hypothetical protein